MNTRFAPTTTVFQKHEYIYYRTMWGNPYYKRKRASGGWSLYCIQAESHGLVFYYCSSDGEPDHDLGEFPMKYRFNEFVLPDGYKP